MKKVVRYIALILFVTVTVVSLNLLIDGVPLRGTPDMEQVSCVVVEHSDYTTKEHTEADKIQLAVAMLGYLHYSPLKGLTDDVPIIKITYRMQDGSEIVVQANEKTVWWNGTARAITDENTFVKMCTAVFYLQNG